MAFLRQLPSVVPLGAHVEVIVRQAIVINPQRKPIAITPAQIEKEASIVVVAEDDFVIVAAIEDVAANFFGPEGAPNGRAG